MIVMDKFRLCSSRGSSSIARARIYTGFSFLIEWSYKGKEYSPNYRKHPRLF